VNVGATVRLVIDLHWQTLQPRPWSKAHSTGVTQTRSLDSGHCPALESEAPSDTYAHPGSSSTTIVSTQRVGIFVMPTFDQVFEHSPRPNL
jgi:hypothetical protein